MISAPITIEIKMACETYCGKECDWIFADISAWPVIKGGTRVDWTLHPRFGDPTPHVFQLQFGRTGNLQADDWVNVGLPVTNGFYAVDPEKRVYGKSQWSHYRIQLTTPEAIYISSAKPLYGNLGKRYWNIVKEIERKELLRLKQDAGQQGFLLKRRLFGEECTCLDHQTREVTNSNCPLCFGTGFTGGYYTPVPCVYGELTPHGHDNKLTQVGTSDAMPVSAGRFLARPQIFSSDVWVSAKTDMRWQVHAVKHIVEVQGSPVVVQAELRLLPYSHPVYELSMPTPPYDLTPWTAE